MKAVVTGGAGFIGSHVVDLLQSHKIEVVVLDNFSTGRPQNLAHLSNPPRVVECDLSESGTWFNEFAGADWVIHLAALADIVPSIQHPDLYYKSNVNGTFNVLQACREHKVKRLVYAASSSCYGIASQLPTPETAEISPQYPYALTKRLGEELVLHWSKVYKVPAVSLRFFNVYGPRSRTSGTYGAMFGVFLAQKLNNKPFTVVGDGEQTRDFTHVRDVASAVLAAAQSRLESEILNVGSGRTISVNYITQLLGGKVEYIPKRPGEPDCTFADISKINSLLGWTPKISIEEGVQDLLRNIEYWREAPVWVPETIAESTRDWFKLLSN